MIEHDTNTELTEQEVKDLRALEIRAGKIDSMRALLDFLEATPEIPMPYMGDVNVFPHDEDTLGELARAMKPVKKERNDSYFMLAKDFGRVKLILNWARDSVCERVVTGTEEIPEQIIEAHTREIVEWICPETIIDRP